MKSAAIRLTGQLSLCLIAGAALAAPAPVRLGSRWDLKEMTRDFPGAVATFQQADAAAAAGLREEALALFQQAARLAPESPAPPRRMCEILTELERREAALAACRQALKYGDAPEDFRAMVGALMSGAAPPSSEDFVQALIMGGGVESRAPHDPAGHAAMFDIARRLGDRRLMRAQLRELERLAPDHYETGRAQRIVAGLGPGPLTVAGWILLLALCSLTAARGISRLRGRTRLLATTAAAMLALTIPVEARAAEEVPIGGLSDFKVDDRDPEASIPPRSRFKQDPLQFGYLVMDLADKADEALKRKDYEAAVRFYRAISKAAPDRAIGAAKVCEVYELSGQPAKALEACRQALVTDGARMEDYERFVQLSLAGKEPVGQTALTEVGNVIAHLRRSPDNAIPAAEIECRLGVRLGDVSRLERCTAELARLAPENTNAIGFEWALAALRQDRAGAERALARARAAGVDLAGVERMAQFTRRAALTRTIAFVVAGVMAVLALGLLVLRRRQLPLLVGRRSPS